jgi:outer membrane protein TolC
MSIKESIIHRMRAEKIRPNLAPLSPGLPSEESGEIAEVAGKTMKLKPGLIVLGLLLTGLVGCKQQVFLSEKVFNDATSSLVREIENYIAIGANPLTEAIKKPADVNDPDRQPWFITLQEAIALCLENGLASGRAGFVNTSLGDVDDSLPSFNGVSLNSQTDRIRVLALNPAISGANMEGALARFDAQWITSMNWSVKDNLQQGLTSFQNGQTANFQSSIVKAFSSGGIANISFLTDYQMLSNPPAAGAFAVFNPFYTTRMQFGFEQPLWRDFGTEINQIARSFPAITGQTMPSLAAAKFNGQLAAASAVTEGILIARLRFDQHRAEFERNINLLLLNVEAAYWNLYKSYGKLYAFEEVMRLSHKAWEVALRKFQAGAREGGDPESYFPVLAQFNEFRGNRLEALGEVLDRERTLRGILGLPVEDGRRLVPISPPTLTPMAPNWDVALGEAMNNRPELILARQNLRFHQLDLIGKRNNLKPDLRFFANYSPVGFGTRLDGNGVLIDGTGTTRPNNANRSLRDLDFADYSLGLVLYTPLGYRLENANVRVARLQLAQSYYLLKDTEEKVQRYLSKQFQKIPEYYRRVELARQERSAYKDAVQVYLKKFEAGQKVLGELAQLDAQRRYALALVKEYDAIAEYNITLARFELAKGSIMQHDNIVIAEGDLPEGAQVRAVENERQRSASLVVRERPDSVLQPARLVSEVAGQTVPSSLDSAAPIPSMPEKASETSLPPMQEEKVPLPGVQVPVPPSVEPIPVNEPPKLIPVSKEKPAQEIRPVSVLPTQPKQIPGAGEVIQPSWEPSRDWMTAPASFSSSVAPRPINSLPSIQRKEP